MPDPNVAPMIVLRCGGRNGTCGKPVFMPFGVFEDIDTLREQLQSVKWALINYDVDGNPVADVACSACLMEYLAGKLKAQGGMPADALVKAALAADLSSSADKEAAALDNDVIDADLTPTGEDDLPPEPTGEEPQPDA